MKSSMSNKPISLTTPISKESILELHSGDSVLLNGILVTIRDRGHKYLTERFINRPPEQTEYELYRVLKSYLENGLIYHCGPVVKQIGEPEEKNYAVLAAGPTTSSRQESYTPNIIEHFGVRGIIGKGGMGEQAHQAFQQCGAVYFHAVGGAAPYIAKHITLVKDVFKMDEFGMPEAFWVLEVKNLEVFVTMDAHGDSFHKTRYEESQGRLMPLIS